VGEPCSFVVFLYFSKPLSLTLSLSLDIDSILLTSEFYSLVLMLYCVCLVRCCVAFGRGGRRRLPRFPQRRLGGFRPPGLGRPPPTIWACWLLVRSAPKLKIVAMALRLFGVGGPLWGRGAKPGPTAREKALRGEDPRAPPRRRAWCPLEKQHSF